MSRERAVEKLHQAHEQGDGYTSDELFSTPPSKRVISGFDRAGFEVKDSGKREQYDSGMQRDTNDGKIRYDLVWDGPLIARLAKHLTLGAVKYQPRNWMKARGDAELNRFRESAVRHFTQWLNGDTDEDHFAATVFNMNGHEYVLERMKNESS